MARETADFALLLGPSVLDAEIFAVWRCPYFFSGVSFFTQTRKSQACNRYHQVLEHLGALLGLDASTAVPTGRLQEIATYAMCRVGEGVGVNCGSPETPCLMTFFQESTFKVWLRKETQPQVVTGKHRTNGIIRSKHLHVRCGQQSLTSQDNTYNILGYIDTPCPGVLV